MTIGLKWKFLFIAGILIPGLTHAESYSTSTLSTPPPPTIYSPLKDLKITGYIDGSYNNLRSNKFTSGSFDRVFDLVPNGYTLQQAAVTIADQPTDGFGTLLNLIAGRDSNGTAPYGFNPQSEFDSQTFSVDWTQAFIQYAKGPATIMVGRFLTLVGEEAINPTLDTNFSRSVLFYNTPDTHTGIRAVFTVTDKITLTTGVNDGWDNIRDWSRRKTIELGFAYNVNSCFSFSIQGLNGQERATPRTDTGPLGLRTLIDVIATINATPKLTLIANYDHGYQSNAALPNGTFNPAHWQGISGYINYAFTDMWHSSLRGDLFEDSDGYRTGVSQNWRALTLTVGCTPIKNLEVRVETRHDFSNVNSFLNVNNVSVGRNNQSYALEAFYKFA